ncbi:MAG: hypothetical protein JWM10_3009 [Myxococcaceae bacterium]|nr:hypothetical protein [Myxococcaceae bacterium]
MPPPLSAALAVDFDHVSGAPDVTFTFVSGLPTSANATLGSGVYRMWLASAAFCFPRALAAVIASDLTAQRAHPYTCIASMSAAGIVQLRIISAFGLPTVVTFADGVWQRLGMASATPTLSPGSGLVDVVGVRPVWHLALFAERKSLDWAPRTPMAGRTGVDGVGYGCSSGITTWNDEISFGYVPRDPTYRTALGLEQTPWEPEPDYLGLAGTLGARLYSLTDLVSADANARTLAFARGNWDAIRGSTSEYFDLVTIPTDQLARPRLARTRAGWEAYRIWTTQLVRQATPTGTRA